MLCGTALVEKAAGQHENTKAEEEELFRKYVEGKAELSELPRLAECMCSSGSRKEAAGLLRDALITHPQCIDYTSAEFRIT
jgi:lipase chaperone LimK